MKCSRIIDWKKIKIFNVEKYLFTNLNANIFILQSNPYQSLIFLNYGSGLGVIERFKRQQGLHRAFNGLMN